MNNSNADVLSDERSSGLIVYSWYQDKGKQIRQEDNIRHYLDECFALSDGVGQMPNGDIAGDLCADTAIWGYKLIRTKKFYWKDKKNLLKRIFRSVNISLWQKQKDRGFVSRMGSTLSMVIVGTHFFWVGNAGNSRVYVYSNSKLELLSHDDTDDEGRLTKVIGAERFGLIPHIVTRQFIPGEIVLMVTDGITDYVSDREIESILSKSELQGNTNGIAAKSLADLAVNNGSGSNMTAVIISKIG